jgi:hypothetical protein
MYGGCSFGKAAKEVVITYFLREENNSIMLKSTHEWKMQRGMYVTRTLEVWRLQAVQYSERNYTVAQSAHSIAT